MIVKTVYYLKKLVSTHRWIFISVILIFSSGFIFSFLVPYELRSKILRISLEKISEFSFEKQTLFPQILWNNLKASIIMLILGIFVIFLPLVLFMDGFGLGIAIDFASRVSQLTNLYNPFMLLLSLLPHGIIEIPTMLLTSFLGFLISIKIVFKDKVEPNLNRRQFIIKIFKTFFIILFPLLVLAAFLEVFVSGEISKKIAMQLVNRELTSSSIDSLIVSSSEINSLGVASKDEDVTLQPELFNSAKYLAVYIYDNDIFQTLKKVAPKYYSQKMYILNGNVKLKIWISELNSEEDARLAIDLYQKMLETLKKKGGITSLNKIEENYYKIVDNKGTYYSKFGKQANFVYYLTYTGQDTKLFSKVVDLQIEKINRMVLIKQ